MERAVRIRRPVQSGAFWRHPAEQHLKETLRHQADFVTKCDAHCQPPYVLFRAFIFSTNDQPFAAAQLELSALVVIAAIPLTQDVEQVTKNVVIDALFRNPSDYLSTAHAVIAAIDGLGMEAPGL